MTDANTIDAWVTTTDKGKVFIDYEALRNYLVLNGFFVDKRTKLMYRHNGGILELLGDDKAGRSAMKRYIVAALGAYKGDKAAIVRQDVHEKLAKGLISAEFVVGFPEKPVRFTGDTSTNIYWPFVNGKIVASKDGATKFAYEVGDCFMYERIPKNQTDGHHRYTELRDRRSEYEQFVRNITIKQGEPENEDNYNHMRAIIGYLLSGYKDGGSPAVIIYDVPKDGQDSSDSGGTGKSLLLNCLAYATYSTVKGAKRLDFKQQFVWDFVRRGMRLVVLQDLPQSFDLEDLYTFLTDGADVNQKFRDSIHLGPNDTPKVAISSNYPVRGGTGHADRRKLEAEIYEFYNDENPVDRAFGHRFPDGWDLEEHDRFYTFLIDCCVYYLNVGKPKPTMVNAHRRKVVTDTCQEFFDWMEMTILNYNGERDKTGVLYMDEAWKDYYTHLESMPHGSVRQYCKPTLSVFKKWCRRYAQFKSLTDGWHLISSHTKSRDTLRVFVELESAREHKLEFMDEVETRVIPLRNISTTDNFIAESLKDITL